MINIEKIEITQPDHLGSILVLVMTPKNAVTAIEILGESIKINSVQSMDGVVDLEIESEHGQVFRHRTDETVTSHPLLFDLLRQNVNRWTVGYNENGRVILKTPIRLIAK